MSKTVVEFERGGDALKFSTNSDCIKSISWQSNSQRVMVTSDTGYTFIPLSNVVQFTKSKTEGDKSDE